MKNIMPALLFCFLACDVTSEPASPRLLEGPPEVSVAVESTEFVGKMLGCFVDAAETIIEYRDGEPVDAVMIQPIELCLSTHAHVSVGSCLRDAMIDAGGQVP